MESVRAFPSFGSFQIGVTLTTSRIFGLGRKFGLKYSLMLSIPAILGATVVELGNFASEDMTVALGFSYLLGAIAAGFVGLLGIRRMISWVRRKNFRIFAYYCFFAGIVA